MKATQSLTRMVLFVFGDPQIKITDDLAIPVALKLGVATLLMVCTKFQKRFAIL